MGLRDYVEPEPLTEPLKPLRKYNDKYWLTKGGRVFKKREDETLLELKVGGSPPRVRFYYNGKETRVYVKYALLESWGVEVAREYEALYG
jgi:hypothetical protein